MGGRIIGIDFSLTCPCICILAQNIYEYSFVNSEFFYKTDRKSHLNLNIHNINPSPHIPYNTFTERYINLAEWVISCIQPQKDDIVFIEDYSMNSRGKVFNIAEATGIVKLYLHNAGVQFILVPPTKIKMFAGKGNWSKDQMFEEFLRRGYPDLRDWFNSKTAKIGSPISDIVDSFFLALYGDNYVRSEKKRNSNS